VRGELIRGFNRIKYSIELPQFYGALKMLEKDRQKYLDARGTIDVMSFVNGADYIYQVSAYLNGDEWHVSQDPTSSEECGGVGMLILLPS
jgi:hypothetical protein